MDLLFPRLAPQLILSLAFCLFPGHHRAFAADAVLEDEGPSATSTLPLKLDYQGREANAPWRTEAESRIDRFRKADLAIVVTDNAGRPLPDANLSVKLKQHAFGWGAATRLPLILDKKPAKAVPATPLFEKAALAKYQELLTSIFNRSGIIPDLREDASSNNQADLMKAVDWLGGHNLQVRGYALVWPDWGHSKWASKFKERDSLNKEITRRISEKVGAFKGKVSEWDVVTEAKNNLTSPNSMFLMAGGADAIVEWCKAARQSDPNARLFITDDGILDSSTTPTWQNRSGKPTHVWISDTVYGYLQQAIAKQAPFDGIGIEGHFKQTAFFTPPQEIYNRLERFAALGKDLAITELEVVVPDPKDEKQAALQADYTRDLLITLFSHPKVSEVTFFAIWEPEMRKNPGALFRSDGSAKPNGQIVQELLQKRWHTELAGKTDAQGKFTGRGFVGKYEISIQHGGKTKLATAELGSDAKAISIKMD